MNPGFDWSTVPNARLAELAKEFTASQIAEQLGCSRNGVIGRCHRKGISLSSGVHGGGQAPNPKKAPGYHRRERPPRTAIGRKPEIAREPAIEPVAPQVEYNAIGVALMDLRDRHCRWPLWQAGAAVTSKFYCGNETAPGSVYCRHCHAVSLPKMVRAA